MRRLTPRRACAAALVAACSLTVAPSALATILYASSFEGASLWKVDTVALSATQIWNTAPYGNQPDSLCFDTAGNLLYSAHLPGRIQSVNLAANTDTTVSSPTAAFGHPTDLALDPSTTTVLASDYITPALKRVSLTGGPTTVLATGYYFSGLAYVGNRLFANAGTIYQHGGNQVLELNPVTGTIVGSSAPNPAGVNSVGDLDGLTYDAFTGHLWATDEDASSLVEFDPNTLSFVSHPLPGNVVGGAILPDGLCGDGLGKLWYASRGDFYIYEYDIASGTSTPLVNIYGLDDLAPASGLGSLPFPEPASFSLVAVLAVPFVRRGRSVHGARSI